MNTKKPFFSIIVPTRNRGQELKNCLDGIWQQTYADYEVLVLDDGSSQSVREGHQALLGQYDQRYRWHEINAAGTGGSGPSTVRNIGLSHAQGQYVAFCDDDDCWHGTDHLAVAAEVLKEQGERVYIAGLQIKNEQNQVIMERHMTQVQRHLENAEKLGNHEVYRLSLQQILSYPDYAHLDSIILAKDLLDELEGFWEHTRFAEDVDLFVRACERSGSVLYRPEICVTHFAPEKRQGESVSNKMSLRDRRLLEMSVYQRLLLICKAKPALDYVRVSLANTQKMLTEELLAENRKISAGCFARSAFAAFPTLKWGLYSLGLSFKSMR
ncbi:glycosyltransferase family 2 protein [Methylocaldum gracile subsp. desertum]|uniref:glycosyltransferase family 2 protein n=1 Tax=Methylocaldum sp. GT1BW TaxID=3438964 RepID=UPI003DA1514A